MRNKLLKSFTLFALLVTVFAGCKEEEPTYMVQVTATENGTVEGQNGEYKEGETVVFTAKPNDGYYFASWSDGSTDNPRTITISNAEISLTAEFVQNPLLTISASENGSIETDVNGRYAPGSNVIVTAKPDDGYGFMRWSDGNTDNPRTITIGNEDISLAALFAMVMVFTPTVDLGLESGTLWATCNVGATNPWDYGNHYAWGETETKDDYSWSWATYKYCKGSYNTITKYSNNAKYGNDGFTDALKTLLPEDDAATAVLGAGWAMPTNTEWKELGNQCYWVWTSDYNNQGVSGYIVYKAKTEGDKGEKVYAKGTPSASYSLSDAHIFLPTAGVRDNTGFDVAGSDGRYWSASLTGGRPDCARYCGFDSSQVYPSNDSSRYFGFSVRPVQRK